mgnify:CR=1 FL=1
MSKLARWNYAGMVSAPEYAMDEPLQKIREDTLQYYQTMI